ncbi:hypothetical protein INT47_008360 [Mucor saturninus]|uniref:Uncharacterized protein n=1 Tax=Mucor saturninus TaxID=64648 RepID=A0A8H7RE60_9FUNG|nr:hypothetical protein INT47_008360 [Mucor saturninus]
MNSQQNRYKSYSSLAKDSKNEKNGPTEILAFHSLKRYTTNWSKNFNSELKIKLKRFAKDTIRYKRWKWTKSGAINKMFAPELRKFNVDSTQTVAAIHKGADRLRTASRAVVKLYSDVQWIINERGSEQDMQHILKKKLNVLQSMALLAAKNWTETQKNLQQKHFDS